jgi:hypothetical protein
VVDPEADLMGQKAIFKTELAHIAGRRANQTVAANGQCSCSQVKTSRALTTLHKMPENLPIATNPVDRRNPILLRSQSPAETTLELVLIVQYQDWMPEE